MPTQHIEFIVLLEQGPLHVYAETCHINEHKFRHSFSDRVNPLCSYSIKPETTCIFFCTATTLALEENYLTR